MQKSENNSAILIGNIFVYYNFYLYRVLTHCIASTFFLEDSHNYDRLIYYIDLISLIFVPFGVYFFSRLASTANPLRALKYALIGMSIATFCIGILPSYFYTEYSKLICIGIFRFLQSFFFSGAACVSRIYLLSNNPDKRVCFSIMYEVSILLGMLLAMMFGEFVRNGIDPCLYCRYAFIFGSVINMVGIYISSDYKNLTLKNKDITWKTIKNTKLMIRKLNNPDIVLRIMQNNNWNILKIAIISVFSYLAYPLICQIQYFRGAIEDRSISESYNGIYSCNYIVCIFIIASILMLILSQYFIKKIKSIKSTIITVAVLLTSIPMFWYIFVQNQNNMKIFSILRGIPLMQIFSIILGLPFMVLCNIWLANSTDQLGNEKYLIIAKGRIFGMYIFSGALILLALLHFDRLLAFSCAFVTIMGIASIYSISSGLSNKNSTGADNT